jgi:hypothetical protein
MSTRGLLFQGASTLKSNSACLSSIKWTSPSRQNVAYSLRGVAEKLLVWLSSTITHSFNKCILCGPCVLDMISMYTLNV